MSNLQVKNVPERVHRRLRALAAKRGSSVRDVVLAAVEKELARDEFERRLAGREPVDLQRPSARTLEEVRSERTQELER
ncbi:MAG: FitA-like ribbon-helix-helix domain-containing protein [Myxococcota bacterium]